MTTLHQLKNSSRPTQTSKRCGRGPGSKKGKTCGRGEKGAGSRSGYKRREGYEGGQMRLFMKLPHKGFSNKRFQMPLHTINLKQIERVYKDGETVNEQSLRNHGFLNGPTYGIKLLSEGDITKKVTIDLDTASKAAREKCANAGIELKTVY